LRDEKRTKRDVSEACGTKVGEHVIHPVLARVQVEHELLLRERGHVPEERPAVSRVVDRAKHRGGTDWSRRNELVQVA
jgi:RNA 3'-terminal phosphate cyclase